MRILFLAVVGSVLLVVGTVAGAITVPAGEAEQPSVFLGVLIDRPAGTVFDQVVGKDSDEVAGDDAVEVAGKETVAVLRWSKAALGGERIHLASPGHFTDENGREVFLKDFTVVWYHQGDTPQLPADVENPATIEALRDFVTNGGGLFLSGVAVRLVTALGVEQAPLRAGGPGHDSFQAALTPLVEDHPIFTGLARTVNGQILLTSAGYPAFADFFGSGRHPAGLLLAKTNYADENPLVEYALGQGRIIVLGWRIPHYSLTENQYRGQLERLTESIVRYLTHRESWVSISPQPDSGKPGTQPPSDRELLSLHMAIEDLRSSFGERYARGVQFLEILNRIAGEVRSNLALGEHGAENSEDAERLRHEFEALRRQALLANPLLDFDDLLYIERGEANLGLPANWESHSSLPPTGYDNRLCVLSLRDPDQPNRVLFEPPQKRYLGDVDLHFAGQRLLVTMPGSFNRFQVFELQLQRLAKDVGPIGVSSCEELPLIREPDVDNYDACYLPDETVGFTSTAPFVGVPCVYGSSHVTNTYHYDPSSGSIRQLTVDQEHNWYPSVLNDGRVLYLRWEYTDLPHAHSRILFSMNPDGTNQMAYYGSNSYFPNSFFYARAVPDHSSKVVGIASGHHGVRRSGRLLILDPALGRQEADGVVQEIPAYGKKVTPLIRDELVDGVWPQFLHPWPLSEKYFLVSCKPSPDRPWGIYLVDVFDNFVLIKEKPGFALFEPVPLKPRERPPVLQDRIDPAQKDALVYLLDVYHGPGLRGVPRGTVKKLRLVGYEFSYRDMGGLLGAIGMDGPWDVKRILGTVPVEEDGSALFRVPAYTPIAVQPLDADGRALQLMRSWFTAMPGEVLSCVGCHEHGNEGVPNIAPIAGRRAPSEIEPWYGPARGFSFAREVQPVLDRFCVSCHQGQGEAFDLRGDRLLTGWTSSIAGHVSEQVGGKFSLAYGHLHPYVRRPGIESDIHLLPPMEFHAGTTELVQILEKGHYEVDLSPEAWDRIVTWIDLNAPYHGTWSEIVGQQTVQPILSRAREMRRRFTGMDDTLGEITDLRAFQKESDASRIAAKWSAGIAAKGSAGIAAKEPADAGGAHDVRESGVDSHGRQYPVSGKDTAEPRVSRSSTVVAKNVALMQSPTSTQLPVWSGKPGGHPAAEPVRATGWPFVADEAVRRQKEKRPWRVELSLAPGVVLRLVRIPPGQFVMGDAAGETDERPPAVVSIPREFWMGECEITNRQFNVFEARHDSHVESLHGYQFGVHGFPLNGPDQPVVRVTWYQALAFCEWLSRKYGGRFTLPTESQWEYACRSGSAKAFWFGDLDSDFAPFGNMADAKLREFVVDTYIQVRTIPNPNPFDDWIPKDARFNDGGLVTMPVASYRSNPWALYDMHGNVWEWTISSYQPYPYREDDGRNNLAAAGRRVVRGGSWYDRPKRCRSAYRLGYEPFARVFNVGFRVVAEELPDQGLVRTE